MNKELLERKELFERIIDSLYYMIDYADDGNVSRQDPNFKEFYDKVDKARELLTELNNMLESGENYKDNEFNNLELAIIDEIDMILDSNYESYDTGIELDDNEKITIAQNIINNDYQIWEDLNCIIIEYIDNILKKRLNYLRTLDNMTTLDPKSEDYRMLCILNDWERGELF